jgi:hypothetical protein
MQKSNPLPSSIDMKNFCVSNALDSHLLGLASAGLHAWCKTLYGDMKTNHAPSLYKCKLPLVVPFHWVTTLCLS